MADKKKPKRADPHWSEYHWMFLTALARHGGVKHAQIIKQAVSEMIARIPDNGAGINKDYCMKLFHGMTDEQKNHPER